MEQRLKSFVDQSQLFLSVAQSGHPDLPSANSDVTVIIIVIIIKQSGF